MKLKLVHPLWTHLPALAALIIMLVYLFTAIPLPAEAPVHFSFGGEPDRYGSPWELVGIFIGLSVFFIALSIFIDELWARQEKEKAFNWLCWLDDVTVGWMAVTCLGYLVSIRNGIDTFSFPWGYTGIMTGAAVLLALFLEALRPFRPYTGKPSAPEVPHSDTELLRQIRSNLPFVYWDNQNPFYVTFLCVLLPLVFLASAVAVWFIEGWILFASIYIGISTLISLALIVFIYGGQRTLVTRQELNVRWGLAGIRVLGLKTAEIASAELHEFAPLRDFGGYGIRFNREMKAYYLHGSRGVKIATAGGKKYLVGSDYPERLLAVIRNITGRG